MPKISSATLRDRRRPLSSISNSTPTKSRFLSNKRQKQKAITAATSKTIQSFNYSRSGTPSLFMLHSPMRATGILMNVNVQEKTLVLNNVLHLPPQGFPNNAAVGKVKLIAPPNTPAIPTFKRSTLSSSSPTTTSRITAPNCTRNFLEIDFRRQLRLKGLSEEEEEDIEAETHVSQVRAREHTSKQRLTPKHRGLKRANGNCGLECGLNQNDKKVCLLQ